MNDVSATRHAELSRFLEGMLRLTGMDFSLYQKAALLRRLRPRLSQEQADSLGELLDKARRDPACLARVQTDLMLPVTSMFRDPPFFQAVRQLLPLLGTYASPRLWVAGCATGPELYSYLILLREAGLDQRCRVYATDMSAAVLRQAQAGVLDAALLPEYEQNYRASGGQGDLGAYLDTHPQGWRIKPELLRQVVFSVHNLLTDASFNEFQFISCRNVMMYFDEVGQRRTHELLHHSLAPFGYLGLGLGESLLHSPHQEDYQRVGQSEPLYRRLR